MNKKRVSEFIRVSFLFLALVSAAAFAAVRLMKIQLVNGGEYLELSKRKTSAVKTVSAARGEIVDCKGVKLAKNTAAYNIVFDYALFPSQTDKQNDCILKACRLIAQFGDECHDILPISYDKPYEFTSDSEEVNKLLSALKLDSSASADDCIKSLAKKYSFDESLSDNEIRTLAGIRYTMVLHEFSLGNDFVLAIGVSEQTAAAVEELSSFITGAEAVQYAVRTYPCGSTASHIIGTTGPIYAEEFENLKEQGYKLSDYIGKSGIEKAAENFLRGKDGEKTITMTSDKQIVSAQTQKNPVLGNSVMLTIDSKFQNKIRNILSEHIGKLQNKELTRPDGIDISQSDAGAVVVIDVKTGAVKACVSYPDYDINDYINNYSEVLNRDGNPLYNRALDGGYRPGSALKAVTAAAALAEGVITPETEFYCGMVYDFRDIQVRCTGHHGNINVQRALDESCNIFFYEVIQKLGLDKLLEYEALFGLGEETGLEIPSKKGYLASPETFSKLGLDWTVGQILQAAIGQSEISVSPLQMAVAAATIANKGTRLQPYLIDSVWDYHLTQKLSWTEPEIVSQISDPNGVIFPSIEAGMTGAAKNTPDGEYSLNTLPLTAAIKTGTPQVSKTRQNSTVIGYYPVEDPQIAFACVVEGGDYSKYMVRKIIDAYYGYDEELSEPQFDN